MASAEHDLWVLCPFCRHEHEPSILSRFHTARKEDLEGRHKCQRCFAPFKLRVTDGTEGYRFVTLPLWFCRVCGQMVEAEEGRFLPHNHGLFPCPASRTLIRS